MKDWEENREKGREGTLQCPGSSSHIRKGINYPSTSDNAALEDPSVKDTESL